MKKFLALVLVMAYACTSSLFATTPATTTNPPAGRTHMKWWATRLNEKEAQAKTAHDTVLIGDSITHNWDVVAPEEQKTFFKNALNLGFSGDRTEHVLWRIRRIDWNVVAPKRIMLMIGTNNTGHNLQAPETIYADIKVLVEELKAKCPQAEITLLKIFPRGKLDTDKKRQNNDAVNAMLDALAEEGRVTVLDISHLYLEADGKTLKMKLLPDALHPNREGHRLWGEAVAPDFMGTK
ncbi:MAG: GDSL-type esterase/lipase family protein [bacterium]|nr:GDSL-type esterase/lipase family protein [bacterium]